MILIACVDDHGGMTFNNRRQSRDKILQQRILEKTQHSRLWMNHDSEKLFAGFYAPQLCADEQFLRRAGAGEYCFVENVCVSSVESEVEKILLYRWNRSYPADRYFDIPLLDHGWRLAGSTDFAGHSHAIITEEVYVR